MTGRELSDEDLRRLRTRSQCLARPLGSALESVTRLVGVQAQDSTAAALNIRVRTGCTDAKDIDTMIGTSRSIVRTWAIRGTLHTLAAGDVHWLVLLLGPRFTGKYRSARLALGLTDNLLERAVDALPEVLRSSAPITRAGLVQRLSDAGIRIGPQEQAPAHLVVAASLRGLLCCGPDTADGKSTYVLLDEWIPRQKSGPTDPLGELAKRYLEGHGPASASDFAAWSGLPTAEARDAIERVAADFEEARVYGEREWFRTTTGPDARVVRLVGGFDSYLLAYRQREFAVDQGIWHGCNPAGASFGRWSLSTDGSKARGVFVTAVWSSTRLATSATHSSKKCVRLSSSSLETDPGRQVRRPRRRRDGGPTSACSRRRRAPS